MTDISNKTPMLLSRTTSSKLNKQPKSIMHPNKSIHVALKHQERLKFSITESMRSSVRQITLKSLKYKTGDAKPILQSSRVFHFHVTVTAPRTRMFTLRSGLCQGDPLAPKGHRLGAGLGRDPGRLRAWRQLSNSWAGALCALLPRPTSTVLL